MSKNKNAQIKNAQVQKEIHVLRVKAESHVPKMGHSQFSGIPTTAPSLRAKERKEKKRKEKKRKEKKRKGEK